jgi:hypothetical protein
LQKAYIGFWRKSRDFASLKPEQSFFLKKIPLSTLFHSVTPFISLSNQKELLILINPSKRNLKKKENRANQKGRGKRVRCDRECPMAEEMREKRLRSGPSHDVSSPELPGIPPLDSVKL